MVCKEHLEEASFSFEQRSQLLTDRKWSWLEVAQSTTGSKRIWTPSSLADHWRWPYAPIACAMETPANCSHALTSVAGNRMPAVRELWRHLDFSDRARVQAVTDALKFELPNAGSPRASGDRTRRRAQFSASCRCCRYRPLPLGTSCGSPAERRGISCQSSGRLALSRMRGIVQVGPRTFWRHPDAEFASMPSLASYMLDNEY